MSRLIAVDSNPLAYRSFHQAQTRELRTEAGIPSGVFFGFLRSVQALHRRFPQNPFLFAFDCGRCWRHDVYPEYKHYGTKTPSEPFLAQLGDLQWFLTSVGYPVLCEEGLEADDLLSIAVTEWLGTDGGNTAFIVSSDRDFFQLVSERCLLYDDRQKRFYGVDEVKESMGVSPAHYLAFKSLLGDVSSDNLPGVKGFGKIKAAQYVNGVDVSFPPITLEDKRQMRQTELLMRLPRTVDELPLHYSRRNPLPGVRSRLAMALMPNSPNPQYAHRQVDLKIAQMLLAAYECKSLVVSDFGGAPSVR